MKRDIIIIIVSVLLLIGIFFVSILYIDNHNNNVNKNYTIVFRGENIDNIYSTYIYKTTKYKNTKAKKKKKIITYSYINTIIVKNNQDYTYSLEKIIKKGTTKDINKIYEIAETNNATTYVEIPKDNLLVKTNEYKNYI